MSLWSQPPEALIETLRARGLRRAWAVTSAAGTVQASDAAVSELAAEIAACPDYRRHEACFFEIGRESDHLLAAFLHDTRRGQGQGGLRFWSYDTLGEMVRDGLRLALGMGQKSALAGLWWGGGKGLIARRPGRDHRDPELRARVYRDYGRFVSSLRGCYVTAEDVGTTPEDMVWVHRTTRFVTCVPEAVGGSGNPSRLTARGVVVAMEAALAHAGRGELAGKTVAMQGLGNVSGFMVEELLARGVARITGNDLDEGRIAALERRFPGAPLTLRPAPAGDASILAEPCDVLAPNAVGAVLNPDTIGRIRAPIVCGSANNQLARPDRDGAALLARGIVYVPDFLCNRMGIVNCANEQYGVLPDDPAIAAHLDRETPYGVYQRTLEVLRRSAESGRSTHEEAARLADELLAEPHPLWPHRGRRIVDYLVRSGWSRAEAETVKVGDA